ncbi:MAG: hypothetical protein IPL33_13325 [Sphingobacteriales bacterium]|nr:hypothetical protein [Sphingobacteriales bacterium]
MNRPTQRTIGEVGVYALRKQPISQVAALLGMGYSQVAHIYQLGAESLISACDPYKSGRNLGIDEIALRKRSWRLCLCISRFG